MKTTVGHDSVELVGAFEVWKRIGLLLVSFALGLSLAALQPWLRTEFIALRRPGPLLLVAILVLTIYSLRNREEVFRKLGILLLCGWPLLLDYLPDILPKGLFPLPPFLWTCLGVVPTLLAVLLALQMPKLSYPVKYGWLAISAYIQSIFFFNLVQYNHYVTFF